MIIPLGYHCNISELNKQCGIKSNTTLFEWFESKKLKYINDVLIKILVNKDDNIINGCDGNLFLINKELFTCHYKKSEYFDVYKRRKKRLLDDVKKSDKILFVRINPFDKKYSTTSHEIEMFAKLIKKINPELQIDFLLIDTITSKDDFKKLDINTNLIYNFHHNYFLYNDCKDDVYLRNNTIIYEKYMEMLNAIDYFKE
jgi:hypothetical protein